MLPPKRRLINLFRKSAFEDPDNTGLDTDLVLNNRPRTYLAQPQFLQTVQQPTAEENRTIYLQELI